MVIDVGAVYDAAALRFDHHQREFDGVLGIGGFDRTKLSSAGLVYKHFGRGIVARELGLEEGSAEAETVFLKVYKGFVEALDAIDNGVKQYDTAEPPRYTSSTDLSARVGKLNPAWNEPSSRDAADAQFAKAMALAGGEFMDAVRYYGKVWLPARRYVKDALERRFETDPSGEILKLERFCPWKDHLFELEQELGVADPLPKYMLYQDDKGGWRVQAVPPTPTSFDQRRSLPAAWRGVRDAQLSEVSGVPGCVFVHAGGFIGGNATLDGALAMARKALTID